MTINFLTITDPHFAGVGPMAYLPKPGAYKQDILAILQECAELAKEYNCAAVLLPGDLTNSHIMSTAVLREFAEALRKFPCPVLTIAGNHDRETSNLDDLKAAPYGVLEAAGVIWDVSKEPFLVRNESIGWVAVGGHPHSELTDWDISQYETPGAFSDSFTVISLTHGMLIPEDPWWAKKDDGDNHENAMRYTTFEKLTELAIPQNLPHIIVNGHNHTGHEATYLPNGTLIVNYGAICRLSRSVDEIKRILRVGLISISGPGQDGKINYKATPIVLKSQRPGEACLDREELVRELERSKTKDKMGEFLNLLGTKREIRVRDARVVVAEAVEELGKAGKLSGVGTDEVRERCLGRLDKVSGAMEAKELNG